MLQKLVRAILYKRKKNTNKIQTYADDTIECIHFLRFVIKFNNSLFPAKWFWVRIVKK